MARYVEVDELKAKINANAWSNPVVPIYVNKVIDRTPTADVAPRSEVAREIFEEIDSLFEKFYNDPLYSCGELGYDIEELKQKYTEEQT